MASKKSNTASNKITEAVTSNKKIVIDWESMDRERAKLGMINRDDDEFTKRDYMARFKVSESLAVHELERLVKAGKVTTRILGRDRLYRYVVK